MKSLAQTLGKVGLGAVLMQRQVRSGWDFGFGVVPYASPRPPTIDTAVLLARVNDDRGKRTGAPEEIMTILYGDAEHLSVERFDQALEIFTKDSLYHTMTMEDSVCGTSKYPQARDVAQGLSACLRDSSQYQASGFTELRPLKGENLAAAFVGLRQVLDVFPEALPPKGAMIALGQAVKPGMSLANGNTGYKRGGTVDGGKFFSLSIASLPRLATFLLVASIDIAGARAPRGVAQAFTMAHELLHGIHGRAFIHRWDKHPVLRHHPEGLEHFVQGLIAHKLSGPRLLSGYEMDQRSDTVFTETLRRIACEAELSQEGHDAAMHVVEQAVLYQNVAARKVLFEAAASIYDEGAPFGTELWMTRYPGDRLHPMIPGVASALVGALMLFGGAALGIQGGAEVKDAIAAAWQRVGTQKPPTALPLPADASQEQIAAALDRVDSEFPGASFLVAVACVEGTVDRWHAQHFLGLAPEASDAGFDARRRALEKIGLLSGNTLANLDLKQSIRANLMSEAACAFVDDNLCRAVASRLNDAEVAAPGAKQALLVAAEARRRNLPFDQVAATVLPSVRPRDLQAPLDALRYRGLLDDDHATTGPSVDRVALRLADPQEGDPSVVDPAKWRLAGDRLARLGGA